MHLEECSQGRNNNLNIIRFIAALMVIFSHSFPLVQGGGGDYLAKLSDGQVDFGAIAVSIFFFYGGFLICKSAMRLKTARDYFAARCLRIIPPMFFVTVILAFVIGPIISKLSLVEYFSDTDTYKYLLNSVFVLVHDLPGVFVDNPYNSTVNGPLWTQPVEFLCYIACFLMFKLSLTKKENAKWTIIPVVLGYVTLKYITRDVGLVFPALRAAMLFYIGILCYVYEDKIYIKPLGAIISFIALIIGVVIGVFNIVIYIFAPYLLLWLAFGTKHRFSDFGRKCEASYGMYLCGWPIQQCLCQYFGDWMTPLYNFIIASILSVFAGIIIFYVVEKPISDEISQKKK